MNKVLFREFTEASPHAFGEELSLLARHDMYFENRIADRPELVEMAHALRYQVYVNERKFENADHHSDGLERDQFDGHSLLGLVSHRQSGEVIGTARLIPSQGGRRDSLPVDTLLAENGVDLSHYVPIGRTVEISRFAISKSFRRRISDDPDNGLAPAVSRAERIRRSNLPCLSLMQLLMRQALEFGCTHASAVMEEKLLRMLASMGLYFTSVGPLIDHHGLRQPCYAYIPELLDRCRREQPECWEVITNAGELIEKLKRVSGVPVAQVC